MVDTQRLQAADAILDQVVPAEAPWSGLRRQGQVLRIIDLGGQQVVDALFHAAGNPAERYSTQDTLLGLGVPYIGLGARLLSNEGRTMATLISPPVEVWRALQDMAVGGLYEDFLDGWLVSEEDAFASTGRLSVEGRPLLMSSVEATADIAGAAVDMGVRLAGVRA